MPPSPGDAWRRPFGPLGRGRDAIEALGIAAWAGLLVALALSTRAERPDGGALTLPLGEERFDLERRGERVGSLRRAAERIPGGYRMEHETWVGPRGAETRALAVRVRLRPDLSMRTFDLRAEVPALVGLLGPLASPLAGLPLRTLEVDGDCSDLAAASCQLAVRGLGPEIRRAMPFSRRPVLAEALRPLLASGGLARGRRAEVSVFDPLLAGEREIAYEVVGQEDIAVAGRRRRAWRVRQEVSGLVLHAWLDDQGHTLREELPLGVTAVRAEPGKRP